MDGYYKTEPMDVVDDAYSDAPVFNEPSSNSIRQKQLQYALRKKELIKRETQKLRTERKNKRLNKAKRSMEQANDRESPSISFAYSTFPVKKEPLYNSKSCQCNKIKRPYRHPAEMMSNVFWEEAVKEAIRGSWRGHENLITALKKVELATRQIKRLQNLVLKLHKKKNSCDILQAKSCKKKKKKRAPSPFIRFYIKVYKELCGKYDIKDIAREAARRWSCMSPQERAKYGAKKPKKSKKRKC